MFGSGEDLCPHCFNNGFTEGKCKLCGFDQASCKTNVNCLPQFTIIDGRYLLGRSIGAGGFGITYAAYNMATKTRCAIKEFFPDSIAYRNANGAVCCEKERQYEYSHGLQRFYDEAVTLATLKDEKNIVKIWEYIKANNTAYIVMEFIDGLNLMQYMNTNKRVFSYPEARKIFIDISVALEKVHIKKLLHRDLTPENVLIKKDGSIKIIDFGSARDYVRNATGMSVFVKRGYAPLEQYSSEKKQGPYTDIYSLCCTVYYMLTKRRVPEAPDRINGENVARLDTIVPDVPKKFAMVIEKGMAVFPENRYGSIGEMLAEIQEPEPKKDIIDDAPPIPPCPPPRPPMPPKKSFWHGLLVFLGIAEDKDERKIIIEETEHKSFNSQKIMDIPNFSPIHLRIDEGPSAGFVYEITSDGIYTVGRSGSQCDAAIEGNCPEISRMHCIITSQDHGAKIFVEDKSANGTYTDRYGKLKQGYQYSVVPGDILYLATKKYAMRIVR